MAPKLFWSAPASPVDTQVGLQSPELATPVRGQAALIDPGDVVYPAPGGGLLRVPVGGGPPAQLIGSASGQLAFWDASAGQWVLTDAPADTAQPVWSVAQNKWIMTPRPAAVRVIAYTAAAPLVMQVQPAGHTPGNYLLTLLVVVRTAAVTGTLSRSYQFSTPTFGAANIAGFGAASITALGAVAASFTTLSAYSDGVNAVTTTLTPAAVTGAPVMDVTAQAQLIGS